MRRIRVHIAIGLMVAGLMGLAWVGQVEPPSRLEQIRDRGELVVAVRFGPSTFYEGRNGDRGLEHDLVSGFADRLGVRLRLEPLTSLARAATELDAGHVDLVAAGIGPTPQRRERFAFTEPYMQVHSQLVYRTGTKRPDGLADVVGDRLEVIAESAHTELLSAARQEHPDLSWTAVPDVRPEQLLYRLWRGRSDYAVTDSNKLTLNQHFYPELRAAFDIGDGRGLAWMLRPDDSALLAEANAYLGGLRDSGELRALLEEYYGHLERFDYVGTRTFMRHTTKRLPKYLPTFKSAAKEHGIDWRLLAAIGYQESHWEPDAVSPTGVRGIMMLTRSTAKQVGVGPRTDPKQSIIGGARYLDSVRSRIPDQVPEPVRTWFALAAYNVGLGHLEDARVITETRGGDPDTWADVKRNLPLLSQKEWYTQTRYGYARGWEPVRYVENIRKYYQLLVRVTEPGRPDGNEDGDNTARGPEDPAGWRLDPAVESAL